MSINKIQFFWDFFLILCPSLENMTTNNVRQSMYSNIFNNKDWYIKALSLRQDSLSNNQPCTFIHNSGLIRVRFIDFNEIKFSTSQNFFKYISWSKKDFVRQERKFLLFRAHHFWMVWESRKTSGELDKYRILTWQCALWAQTRHRHNKMDNSWSCKNFLLSHFLPTVCWARYK